MIDFFQGLEAYRSAILAQINEKERERIRMRKLKFQEGEALRAEEEMRKKDLKHTMMRKLEELRQVNLFYTVNTFYLTVISKR